MSIQAVSFGKQAYSNNGNKYEKTNLGTKIGAALGLGIGSLSAYKYNQMAKEALSPDTAQTTMNFTKEFLSEKAQKFVPNIEESMKFAKKMLPLISAIMIGTGVLVYGSLGKLVDVIVNKFRAKNADNKAVSTNK